MTRAQTAFFRTSNTSSNHPKSQSLIIKRETRFASDSLRLFLKIVNREVKTVLGCQFAVRVFPSRIDSAMSQNPARKEYYEV